MYFVPTKDTETSKIPRMCPGIGRLSLIQFCSQASEKRGSGADAFMSPTLVIQERVVGNMMQVLLVFLQKFAVK